MPSIRSRLLVGACLALSSFGAHAAELPAPALLADLIPGVATVPFRWEPYPLAAASGRRLFTVYLPDGGTELWSSDGTAQGSERILPADAAYVEFAWEEGNAAGALVDQGDSVALLRTDGTAAGTATVAIWPGTDMLGWYGRGDGRTWIAPCYEVAGDDAADRCELWKIEDGASTPERLADDLPLEYQCCSPAEQPTVDGRLFFFTVENGNTRLWRSDGTPATTVALAQLPPESFVYPLGRSGRRFVFGVDAADGGSQVWTSDGTVERTRALVPLPTDPWPAGWDWYYRKHDPFFFTAHDPATRSTVLWAVGLAGQARRLGSFAQIEGDLHAIGAGPTPRYLFAAARNAPAPGEQARLRLWTTDGTPGGTMELRSIPGGPLRVEHLWGIAAGRLYFTAGDGSTGVELWSTDGTAAGTRQVADACPGPCGSRLHGIASVDQVGATVLFIADGGGAQMLWRSDGTSASPVVPLTGGDAVFSQPDDPFGGPAASGHAFFSVGAAGGFALWATDGTAAGTGPVVAGTTAPLGSDPAPLAVSAQTLLFAADDELAPEHRRLYLQRRGEPLAGGVRLPEYVRPTAGAIDDARGLALFVGSSGDYGSQLWTTDGTAAGTVQLTAFGVLSVFTSVSTPDALTGDKYYDDCEDAVEPPQRSGDRWFFFADLCSGRRELWATDGSLADTHRSGLLPDEARSPVLVGNAVFFVAPMPGTDGTEEPQLFRQPLAGGQAAQLTQREGGLPGFFPWLSAPTLGSLFFTVTNGDANELWVSDGSAAGTGAVAIASDGSPLEDVRSVAAGSDFALVWTAPPGLPEDAESILFAIPRGSRVATRLAPSLVIGPPHASFAWVSSSAGVFFGSRDPQHGYEPWFSDGTPAGTHAIDLQPGPASSSSSTLVFVPSDAGVFFIARSAEAGEELWIAEADGSNARLAADLAPGRASSAPSGLVAGPGGLLFVADDGASGREPWLLEWDAASAGEADAGGVR
jgi:ELWxxDGT repeat protein